MKKTAALAWSAAVLGQLVALLVDSHTEPHAITVAGREEYGNILVIKLNTDCSTHHLLNSYKIPTAKCEVQELQRLAIDVRCSALVVRPGEGFTVTAAVTDGLAQLRHGKPIWLGLQFSPSSGFDGAQVSKGSPGLVWEKLEGDKAAWALELLQPGEFRATVIARTVCSSQHQALKQTESSSCFQPLPLAHQNEVKVKVAEIAARLKVSWDKPQTIRAFSDTRNAQYGALQVSALALDGSGLLNLFKGTVQLFAVDTNGAGYSPLQGILGGTTNATLKDGFAEFTNLELLQAGTFKIVAVADGAQAAETAPLVVTALVSRVLRFCEQPPAVLLMPRPPPIRLAVEVISARGERDTTFEGQVQVQLHGRIFDHPLPKDQYKTQCHLGLCLWSSFVLVGPPGSLQLKATVVQQTKFGASDRGLERDTSILPAFSAPIELKQLREIRRSNEATTSEVATRKEIEGNSFFRAGQLWDLEVAVSSTQLGFRDIILAQEYRGRKRAIMQRRYASSAWSSWTRNCSIISRARHARNQHRLHSLLERAGGPIRRAVHHKLHVVIAESWPTNSIVLSGHTESITDTSGVALFSRLSLRLQNNRSSNHHTPPWVKLRVECLSCDVLKGEYRPSLEASKIYVDIFSVVGVFSDPLDAASAIVRRQSMVAHTTREKHGNAALVLPGRPAQLCVQLFERPFADVLIAAQHGPDLVNLGAPRIRVSPYTWPQPACWHFAVASRLRHQHTSGPHNKVAFKLTSADIAYNSSKKVIRWGGLAASDGTVRIIVLPSRIALKKNGLLQVLQKRYSSQAGTGKSQESGQPRGTHMRDQLQAYGHISLHHHLNAAGNQAEPPVIPHQGPGWKVNTTLQWRVPALAVELLPPQTHVILELRPITNFVSTLQITGRCVDLDAGGTQLADVNQSLSPQDLSALHETKTQGRNAMQRWYQVEIVLDWDSLNPESAGLLQHHVVCEFHGEGRDTPHVEFVPRASVEIIILRRQCGEGEIFTFRRNSCYPCPEDFDCSLGTPKPCLPGEFSPTAKLTCEASRVERGALQAAAVWPERTGCPMGTYLLRGPEDSLICSVCPAGFSCNGKGKELCPTGTYSPVSSEVCIPCPEDSVCSDPAEHPVRCPFGWQRKGDAPECTPCPAGRMCSVFGGYAERGSADVECQLGTYTKREYPGICVPCPPGFQCPDPKEMPQECPAGTSSLGGRRKCSSAPIGLIVAYGMEHLPPRPCEIGLTPVAVQGRWWCGIEYETDSSPSQQTRRPARSSPSLHDNLSGAEMFANLCTAEYIDHASCFGSVVPPKTWCPAYHLDEQKWPTEFNDGPFFGAGGGFSQYFTSCGYTQTADTSSTRVKCRRPC
ncbi:uncharacterized protein LOC113146651 [Cyclospora cayetanensis]|uniref:Uncharacterized protein LOC113146651 n=1 Tax=Cyclospora cayetanensis TaxID=88456 RepID=A0A6P6RSE7_9EIME|nr:uncharacterized protein LOC113146651 [Cyclospora cayetanensis]